MIDQELMQILKEISDDCKEHRICGGCKFHADEGCVLRYFPDGWKLDKIESTIEEERYCIFDMNHDKANCAGGEE